MKIQSVRGMQDLLPAQKEVFRFIEDTARQILASYGYEEVGLPFLESTDLFKRLVGEATDIVEKEMYAFEDRNGDNIALRPEGTAGCARYALQNGLIFNQVRRLWYSGAMFRHEKPQLGRYRQFDQIAAETYGMPGPDIDIELLLLNLKLWRQLGLDKDIHLQVNSLGSLESRQIYRSRLVEYLTQHESALDEDSRRRLSTNPLRILDSKIETTRAVLSEAPLLTDFIDDDSRQHFAELCRLLEDNGVQYTINPFMVRGLDYYNKTVFEWVTDRLGAQGAVCAGGRYDTLVEQIGGRPTSAVGFALGVDRLALMLEGDFVFGPYADIYLVSAAGEARARALSTAEALRKAMPDRSIVVHCGDGKFKAQMKKADASDARLAIILGEDELAAGKASVKLMRDDGRQEQVTFGRLGQYCAEYFEHNQAEK